MAIILYASVSSMVFRWRLKVATQSMWLTHRCGKLIPSFRARDRERSGTHRRWRPWYVFICLPSWPQMCAFFLASKRVEPRHPAHRYAGAYAYPKATPCIKTTVQLVCDMLIGAPEASEVSALLNYNTIPWSQDQDNSRVKYALQRRQFGVCRPASAELQLHTSS